MCKHATAWGQGYENPATLSGCKLLFLIELFAFFSVAGIVIGNAYFKSLDKPELREALILTILCIPSKVLCSLFNISETICLNNK